MKTPLSNKTILLIVTGGIAAYKSLDLVRKLKDAGACVSCVLTQGGAQFVTPLALATLSGEPVSTDLFSPEQEQRLGHIRLSRQADLIVVAPATANTLAKMAHGLADNLASAVLLASNKPILIAPAMNSQMWASPATQANLATLQTRGIHQVGPASGMLACGETGEGRMAEPDEILLAITALLAPAAGPLTGRKALVTSGPTYEPIDPVRFIGNRSSGKQGHAIAAALAALGAEVTLVTGPTALPAPAGVPQTIPIQTAREMLDACLCHGPYDIAVCAAAVADWRPAAESERKIKKEGEAAPTFSLIENPDILATLSQAATNRPRLVIGFAAETDNVLDHAKAKFARKGCDWILANKVGAGQGFGQDSNEVTLIRRNADGSLAATPWPAASKQALAQKLAEAVAEALE